MVCGTLGILAFTPPTPLSWYRLRRAESSPVSFSLALPYDLGIHRTQGRAAAESPDLTCHLISLRLGSNPLRSSKQKPYRAVHPSILRLPPL